MTLWITVGVTDGDAAGDCGDLFQRLEPLRWHRASRKRPSNKNVLFHCQRMDLFSLTDAHSTDGHVPVCDAVACRRRTTEQSSLRPVCDAVACRRRTTEQSSGSARTQHPAVIRSSRRSPCHQGALFQSHFPHHFPP